MTIRGRIAACIFAMTLGMPLAGQNSTPSPAKDIDPLALRILQAATDQIKNAKSYSFRALVSRDYLGTNDQIITLFTWSEITVQRPNNLHIKFRGAGQPVEMFFNGSGSTVLFSPSANLYTTIATPTTIDAALDNISKKGVTVAVRNFLESDPYKSLTAALVTAYAVGTTDLFDQKVYHLAFTEPDADWQMWLVGTDQPQVRRVEIIDKTDPQHLRIAVDFLDWNFSPQLTDTMFTFSKPADAHQIDILKETTER
jgi:hypothetical protein